MTSPHIAEVRQAYLASLMNMQASRQLLETFLRDTQTNHPQVIESLAPFGPQDQLDPNPLNWNADYFYAQKSRAAINFSIERLQHLLTVREHLQRKGVNGFVPTTCQPATAPQPAHAMHSNYLPSDNLRNFVAEGDLPTIRTALRLELNDNRLTAADLRAALAWTQHRVSGLLDAYADKAFARGMDTDPQGWTSQYYELQVVYLKTNFAEERFLHLIEVRERLRQQGVEGFVARPPQPRTQHPNPAGSQRSASAQSDGAQAGRQTEPPLSAEHPAVKTALLIGGAVAALAALLIALIVR